MYVCLSVEANMSLGNYMAVSVSVRMCVCLSLSVEANISLGNYMALSVLIWLWVRKPQVINLF
jgi:hypothetical protein